MFEYKFKIEKDRIYRNYKPTDVVDFKTWLESNYDMGNEHFNMIIAEDDKYIKFLYKGYYTLNKEELKQQILGRLRIFKEYFITEYCADLQVDYLDIKSANHKNAKERLEILMSVKNSKQKKELFEVFSILKKDFMSFEPLVAIDDLEEPKVNEKEDTKPEEDKPKLVGKAKDRANEQDNQFSKEFDGLVSTVVVEPDIDYDYEDDEL